MLVSMPRTLIKSTYLTPYLAVSGGSSEDRLRGRDDVLRGYNVSPFGTSLEQSLIDEPLFFWPMPSIHLLLLESVTDRISAGVKSTCYNGASSSKMERTY